MSHSKKNVLLHLTLFSILVALMAWAIHISYGDVKTVDGEPVLTNWPYVRMAIQMAILNFFIATSMARLKKIRDLEKQDEQIKIDALTLIFFFASGFIPLLYYPGLTQLGLTGGDSNFTTFAGNLLVIQTIYFYLIVKITLKEEVKLVTYGLLLLLAFAVIFISDYLPGTGSQSFYIDQ